MAEARVEDEEESLRETPEAGGARRNPRAPTAASGRADRNKPEQRQSSSQGALSSIRAVMKRTSNRTAAPTNQSRERRRPEITILAAEPLVTNSWFPGPSGAFPPPPPPAQPPWSTSVTVELPPPSYEQVIREKSRERIVYPSSSSSSSSNSSSLSSSSSSPAPRHTTTISTQTDPEVSESHSCTRPPMRRPPKPPRPSFPPTPKPAEPVLVHTHSLIELDEPDSCCSTHTPAHRPLGARSDVTPALEPSIPISVDSSRITHNPQPQARPRPCSRSHSKGLQQSVITEESPDQPVTREVKVQTLVRLKDDGESVYAAFTDASVDTASNAYLQDLLDVFGCDIPDVQHDQHDGGDRSGDKEKRNALESCPEIRTRPEPRPRTQKPKPALAPKPCGPAEEPKAAFHPVPAPRPLVRKSAVFRRQGSSEEKAEPCQHRLPPRPLLAATQDGEAHPAGASVIPSEPSSSGAPGQTGKPGEKSKPPSNRPPAHTPVHTPAQDAVSSASSLPHRARESKPLRPPPIKSSKSAASSQTPAATNQHLGPRGAKRGPPLPPRPNLGHPLYADYTSKRRQGTSAVTPPSSDPAESYRQEETLFVVLEDAPGLPGDVSGRRQAPVSEDPVCHKSPDLETDTGVRLRAHYAFAGEDGELTFAAGDVITLMEYVNEEWGRGSLDGREGNFPLNFVQLLQESPENTSTPGSTAPAVPPVGERRSGRALYDFTCESEYELRLKVGDVVSSLEEVDEQWFIGELAGVRGIVPKDYIQML